MQHSVWSKSSLKCWLVHAAELIFVLGSRGLGFLVQLVVCFSTREGKLYVAMFSQGMYFLVLFDSVYL